jgi:hypothetical protein
MGLIIGATEFSQKRGEDNEDDHEQWSSISPAPHFKQFMAFSRFKDFRRFLPSIYRDDSRKESDPWWDFSGVILLN